MVISRCLMSFLVLVLVFFSPLPARCEEKLAPAQIMMAYTNISVQMKNLACALDMYKTDNKRYPGSLSQIYPTYLKKPSDTMKDSYFTYLPSQNGQSFQLQFNQGAPPGVKVPGGYPRYDSTKAAIEYMPGITDFEAFLRKITW
ncbi:MAG: hypothetical protein RDV48_29630 [Candidatus Eremiobacteraeota bacterium]|nr:hypothetical protein [Candidatus Eremiobacteraeota bacterium]